MLDLVGRIGTLKYIFSIHQ